jgi:hypothetical protein
MDLLERYLQAVRFFLPQKNQDDIVRELSENLISQMEDRQEELGRPLTEAEQADILRRHGHPMIVAGRYRSRQQLIGPVFFPIYLFALKTGLGAALLVTVVLGAIAAILNGNPLQQAVQAMQAFPARGLMVFAWTTLGFAAVDIIQGQFTIRHEWDPRSLPKVVKHEHRIARMRTLCELFFVLVWFVWLLLVPQAPFLLLGPAAAIVDPAPVWRSVYVPIVLITLATAVWHVINFIRPYWTTTRSLSRAALHGATFLVFVALLRGNEWFVAKSGMTASARDVDMKDIVDLINMGCQIGFFVAAIMSVIEILRELLRLRARSQVPVAADSAPAGGR